MISRTDFEDLFPAMFKPMEMPIARWKMTVAGMVTPVSPTFHGKSLPAVD